MVSLIDQEFEMYICDIVYLESQGQKEKELSFNL